MSVPKPNSIREATPSTGRVAAAPEVASWVPALELWLRWNECYEQVTSLAFAAGNDPRQLEDLMDAMDQIRREAIELSKSLLAGR